MVFFNSKLELGEGLLDLGCTSDLESVELDRLAEGSALSHGGDVTHGDITEAGRKVDRHVLVSLDVVQVISPDDGGVLHLELGDDSSEDTSSDGALASEGTLLVDVVAELGLHGDLEAQPWVAVPPGLGSLQAV